MKKHLIWFRNDLRTLDNLALRQAATVPNLTAIYCFDPRQFGEGRYGFVKTAAFRAQFLIETVQDLRTELAKLNIPLFVYFDRPEELIPKFVKEQDITAIYFQKEWTEEEEQVQSAVANKLPEGVAIHDHYDQFLYHPEDIPFDSFAQIPAVFTQFRKKCEKYGQIRPIVPKPKPLPKANLIENPTEMPSLSTLGLSTFKKDPRTAFPFSGGERSGLERIQSYFWDTKKLAYYKKTRNGLVGTDYSSKLSAWLANGSLSARTIYWEVKRFEKEIKKNQDTYWLVFELIWRDFFKYISLKHGNSIFLQGGILQKDYEWKHSQKALDQWINGNTPEPS